MTKTQKIELDRFKTDRNEALLSMDEGRIRAMLKTYNGVEISSEPEIFWCAVHKAITGNASLPIEFRRISKVWLDERGLASYDDGEL